MKLKILCDFDGTIAIDDISMLVLEKFADGDWRQYEDLVDNGLINIEECLTLQFNLVKTPKKTIIEYVHDKIQIRDGFTKFVEFCSLKKLELIIVSAGLDFVIDKVQNDLNIDLPVIVPTSHFNNKLSFTFPNRVSKEAEDFKADEVLKWKKQGHLVLFIGDGGSDYFGAVHSDIVYAVKSKSLENFLQRAGKTNLYSFTNFDQIIHELKVKPHF